MGMPQIPDGKNRPSFEETLIDLLESVAMEELALAHIMNAEGEKLQELIRKYACRDICYHQFENSCKNVGGMINSLIMKEWLLMSKLNTIIDIKNNLGEYYDDSLEFGDVCTPSSSHSHCSPSQMPVRPPRNHYPDNYGRSFPQTPDQDIDC